MDYNQLHDPLPFSIIYTNIVLVLKSQSARATTKIHIILVYMFLNGKGGLACCGLYGCSLVAVPLEQVNLIQLAVVGSLGPIAVYTRAFILMLPTKAYMHIQRTQLDSHY